MDHERVDRFSGENHAPRIPHAHDLTACGEGVTTGLTRAVTSARECDRML
jgi:hypothetical protein